MNTYLILLGFLAAFVAVDGFRLAESKRYRQTSEVNLYTYITEVTGDILKMVQNFGALKKEIEAIGGYDQLEDFVTHTEVKLEQFLINRLSPNRPAPTGSSPARPTGPPPPSGGPPPVQPSGPPPRPSGPPPKRVQSTRSLKQLLAELMKISKE